MLPLAIAKSPTGNLKHSDHWFSCLPTQIQRFIAIPLALLSHHRQSSDASRNGALHATSIDRNQSLGLQTTSVSYSVAPPLSQRNSLGFPQQVTTAATAAGLFNAAARSSSMIHASSSCPSLYQVEITFSDQVIFHIPQLARFINRIEGLKSFNQAKVGFINSEARLSLLLSGKEVFLLLQIVCNELDWQVSSLTEVCDQLHPLVSRVEVLES